MIRRAVWGSEMPEKNTKWAGVTITTRPTDSKLFVGLVETALDKIYSKPVGKSLLDAIAAEVGKAGRGGYTVTIYPKDSVKETFGPFRWRVYQTGSVTKTGSELNATNGTGSISIIRWDPKANATPDGARPPFIALAHELIHCMHNLKGTSHLLTIAEKKIDEMMVTGLRGYEQEPISENRIRGEHGIAYRNSYGDVCSYAEGKVDKNAF